MADTFQQPDPLFLMEKWHKTGLGFEGDKDSFIAAAHIEKSTLQMYQQRVLLPHQQNPGGIGWPEEEI